MHVTVCCGFSLFISINNVQLCERACYRLPLSLFSLSLYLCLSLSMGQLQGCFSSDSNVCKHEIPQKILKNRCMYVDRNTSVSCFDLADAQLDNQLRWLKLQSEWRRGRQQHCMQRESVLLACFCLKLFAVNVWKAAEKTHTYTMQPLYMKLTQSRPANSILVFSTINIWVDSNLACR